MRKDHPIYKKGMQFVFLSDLEGKNDGEVELYTIESADDAMGDTIIFHSKSIDSSNPFGFGTAYTLKATLASLIKLVSLGEIYNGKIEL